MIGWLQGVLLSGWRALFDSSRWQYVKVALPAIAAVILLTNAGLVGGLAGGALLLAALLHVSRWPVLQPLSTTFLICGLAMLPQAVFIVGYEWGFEDFNTELPRWVAQYEAALLVVHDGLTHLKVPGLLLSGLSLVAFLLAAYSGRTIPGLGVLKTYRTWIGRALLALFAATSFTLVSIAPAAKDMAPASRLRAEIRAQEKYRTETQLAEDLQAHAGDARFLADLQDTAAQLAQQSGATNQDIQDENGPVMTDPWAAVLDVTGNAADRQMTQVVDQVAAPPPARSADPAAEPGPPPTLEQLRAARRATVTFKSAADLARKKAVDAIHVEWPSTGLPLADGIIDEVVKLFLDKASERLVEVGFDHVGAKAKDPQLDRSLHDLTVELADGFLKSRVSPAQRQLMAEREVPKRFAEIEDQRAMEAAAAREKEKARETSEHEPAMHGR